MIDENPSRGLAQRKSDGFPSEHLVPAMAGVAEIPPLPETRSRGLSSTLANAQARLAADELALIERIRAGEKDLFMELVQPYQKVVYSMAVSIVKNDQEAEDTSQEALFKAFKGLAKFRGECKFSTWLIQITVNEARHRLRRKKRAAEESLESGTENQEGDYIPIDLADWREIPSEALQRKELRETLQRAISNLKPIYRDVLVLRDIQHLTVSETSDLLKISVASVKTRLLRARLQVRDALAPGIDGSWNTGSTMYKRVRPF